MIHITSGQSDDILDFITENNFFSDVHRQSLQDNLETYEFTTFADKPFSEHLGKLNRVIIPAEDQGYKEFIINESLKYRDTSGLKTEIYADASYLQLKKAKIIDPQTFKEQTPTTAVSYATNGTEWRPGIIEGDGYRTFHVEDYTNPYAFLKRIATEFGLELRFRVEVKGGRIVGRYVDLLELIGEWRGREVEFGRDLIGIQRREKTDNIYTALKGLGPEKDDGTHLEVIVVDEEALQRWGRPDPISGDLQHLWDTYEPQSTDQEMTESRLRELTENELEKRVNEVVEYESTIADLENVPGMENKKIRFGDTIKIKDTKFNPPLYLEARVHTQERSIKDKSQKNVVLGDYIEYTEEEVQAVWQSMQAEIRRRLARMLITNIASTAGDTFKNGVGETELTAEVFLSGSIVDEAGENYTYVWNKRDKNGIPISDWNQSGKTITVTAAEIDEKATFTVDIVLDTVLSIGRITITNVFDGERGPEGEQGIPGEPGKDGRTSYTHVAYANSEDGTEGFSTSNSVDKRYIGIYVDFNISDSTNPSDYNWTLIKGADGSQGLPGPKGEDGRTPYFHTAWANNSTGTSGFSTTDSEGKLYIGTYTDFTQGDSTDPSVYSWVRIKGDKGDKGEPGAQGVPGPPGEDGQSLYTWVKYADSPTSGMSDSPTNKEYIGLAYNKTTPTESTDYNDYTWAKTKGDQGVPGEPGADGTPRYTWTKYADDKDGNGMSDSPDGKRYLGLAYNKTTATESNNASDYSWSPLYDNVKVGGVNLFIPNSTYNSRKTKEVIKRSPYSSYVTHSWNQLTDRYILEGDREFTISLWAKVKSGTTNRLNVHPVQYNSLTGTDRSASPSKQFVVGEEWVFITYTLISDPQTVSATLYFKAEPGVSGDEIWINAVKIEKGNIATDWEASPEEIETAYTAVAEAKAEAERIKAEAYADGIVSEEEARAIQDANKKLEEAVQHANIQANTAQEQSMFYSKVTSGVNLVKSLDTPSDYEMATTEMPDGSTAMAYRKTADTNSKMSAYKIKVDPTKAYLIEAWVKSMDTNSRYYIGREEYTADLQVNDQGNGPYGVGGRTALESELGKWVKHYFLIPPHTAGEVNSHNTQQSSLTPDTEYKFWNGDTAYIDIKIYLAYSQTAPTEMYITNIGMYEVGSSEGLYSTIDEVAINKANQAEKNAEGYADTVSEAAYLDAVQDAEDYMEANGVMQGADYNGVSITNQDGFVTARGDGLVRTVSNSTLGYVIQRRASTSSPWVNVLYFDTNGNAIFAGDLEGAAGTFKGNISTENLIIGPETPETVSEEVGVGNQVTVKNAQTLPNGQVTWGEPFAITVLEGVASFSVPNFINFINPNTGRYIPINALSFETNEGLADIVVEKGSNSNGHYIRYNNGIQICWHYISELSINTSTHIEQGITFYRSGPAWNYPASFIDVPSFNYEGDIGDSGYYASLKRIWSMSSTTAAAQFLGFRDYNRINRVSYFAIGRWK